MLLALDQSSTRTGLCVGRPDGPVSLHSSRIKKRGSEYGAALAAYGRWLNQRIDEYRPTLIVYEQPVRPNGMLNLHTARLLYGLCGIIEVVALQRSIPCLEVHNQKVKVRLYGKGGKKPKERDAVRMARAWGFDATNSDEADAAGVFLVAVENRFPEAFKAWMRVRAGANS